MVELLTHQAERSKGRLLEAFRRYGNGPLSVSPESIGVWGANEWIRYLLDHVQDGTLPRDVESAVFTDVGDCLMAAMAGAGVTIEQGIVRDDIPPELRRGGRIYKEVFISAVAKHIVPFLTSLAGH